LSAVRTRSPRSSRFLERGDALPPGGVDVGPGGQPLGELEQHQAVGERPERPGARELAGDPQQRRGGAVLDAGWKLVAGERSVGHQQVQVWMGECEAAVRGGECGQRLGAGVVQGGFQDHRQVLQARGDDGDLKGCLVRQVLVQRGRLDAEPLGHPAHRQRLGPVLVEQLPGDRDDLPGARGELSHARAAPRGA